MRLREDRPGDKRLVGYVTAQPEVPLTTAALRTALRAELPDYLVPSALVVLETLPLTPHGKVDRHALPAPESVARTGELVAPRTPTEELLAGVWAEVLGVAAVSVTDNFFDLGGHSLLMFQIQGKLRQAF